MPTQSHVFHFYYITYLLNNIKFLKFHSTFLIFSIYFFTIYYELFMTIIMITDINIITNSITSSVNIIIVNKCFRVVRAVECTPKRVNTPHLKNILKVISLNNLLVVDLSLHYYYHHNYHVVDIYL